MSIKIKEQMKMNKELFTSNDKQLQQDLNELLAILLNSSNPNASIKTLAAIMENEIKRSK